MSCRRFFSIPVLSVILVMGFVYYVTLFVFIDDWVGLQSSAGKLNALLFSFLASLCLFSLSICVLVDPGRVPASYAPDVEDSSWSNSNVSCGIFMIGLSITLGTLLCWHIYLIAHNMTTIEHYDSKRASWLARKSGQSYRHQFDVGVYKNLTSVLGPNMIKWLCPTYTRNPEDGISFSASRDS